MRKASAERRRRARRLALYHVLLLGACSRSGTLLTEPGLVAEEFAKNTAFFFGEPLEVLKVIWEWFVERQDLPAPRRSRCVETLLAFAVGSVLGLVHRAVARAVADGVARSPIPTSRR